MGQKVNPVSFRIGINQPWKSRWFARGTEYRKLLLEDVNLRKVLENRLKLAGVNDIQIERLLKSITIKIAVSRPGIVIGRGGSGIEDIKKQVLKELGLSQHDPRAPKIDIQVEEIKNPELSAKLVSQRIVAELERRMPHRRVTAKVMDRVMAAGAKGIKIFLAGRIGGAEIGRTEKYHRGSVSTHTLRSEIDYAQTPALLKRGYVGVKVWITKPKATLGSMNNTQQR